MPLYHLELRPSGSLSDPHKHSAVLFGQLLRKVNPQVQGRIKKFWPPGPDMVLAPQPPARVGAHTRTHYARNTVYCEQTCTLYCTEECTYCTHTIRYTTQTLTSTGFTQTQGEGINGLKINILENDYAHFSDGALGHLRDIMYWKLVAIMK